MIELIILPRVPKHPAFLSSPSHLDRCASLQSHRVGVKSARSAWRRRLQTSSDTGLLLPLLLLLGTLSCAGAGSCSEVSKPRGSCRSDACTVRSDSPTWPQRPSRTWRSSASPTQCAGKKTPVKLYYSPPFLSEEVPSTVLGETAHFILLHSCTRADQSARSCCVTQWRAPAKQLLNFLTCQPPMTKRRRKRKCVAKVTFEPDFGLKFSWTLVRSVMLINVRKRNFILLD